MKTSLKGKVEIISSEGMADRRYRDSKGIWTIGVGHAETGNLPRPSQIIRKLSVPEILQLLGDDLAFHEAGVNKAFTVPLEQHEFDAAVSFDLNTGRIHDATWVKKINEGDRAAAKLAIMWFNKPKEIIERRRRERDLFFSGQYGDGNALFYHPDGSGPLGHRESVNVYKLIEKATTSVESVQVAPVAPPPPQVTVRPSEPEPAPAPLPWWKKLLNALFGE